MSYDPASIEPKWSDRWFETNLYRAEDDFSKEKRYILLEFPYPSGTGLHCGHVYRFTMPDVYARKLRMQGFNVLFPMGWDAFGLPAEQYAVQTGVHPSITTEQAIATFRRQLRMLGYGFDWEREINSTDPSYYKWTQWIFLKFFERGLAELREQPVWWCEKLRTVLANEEVLDDGAGGKVSERGSHPVERRMLKQWVLKIPQYADKLLEGLEKVDFPDSVKYAQRNWIGRSTGATIRFALSVPGKELSVFTTRPDTILGATFMVLAPEHPLIEELGDGLLNRDAVLQYRRAAQNRSDVERKAGKEKTGVRLEGVTATNPVDPNLPPIPLFVADYVLMEYGTGAIMAVPAHDERDFEFAKQFSLPVVPTVYSRKDVYSREESSAPGEGFVDELPFVSEDGFVHFAGNWCTASEMKEKVIVELERSGRGTRTVTYKIRDWLFSRQRYWGEPIPLIHREDGSIEAIVATEDAEGVAKKLPLLLPEVPDYLPSADGYSPLSKNKEWITTADAKGRPATRETNTMPNWAGSCWYYLRYLDPKNESALCAPEKLKYWLPVDKYFGGSEHTTLHLLYSRFWHRFLYDEGVVPTEEPYAWRMNGGVLLGPDSQRMSKSRGNVVNPDDKVLQYGADALRLYICFMGPYDGTLPWSETGLKACRRLLDRIFELQIKVGDEPGSTPQLVKAYHKLVKNVSWMVDALKANTAVSEIMIFVREAEAANGISRDVWSGFLRVLAPFAVFSAEELWAAHQKLEAWEPSQSVHRQPWPQHDEALATDDQITLGVQVNGKLRDQVTLELDESEDSVREKVLALPGVQKWVDGKPIKKFIYVKNKIVNVVA